MPAHSWTTTNQLEFLKSYRPAHSKAQEESTLPSFWTTIYRDFFAQWPDRASEIKCAKDSLEHNADEPGKEATKKKNKKTVTDVENEMTPEEWVTVRREGIYNWYNNHGLNKGTRRSGQVKSVKVILQPPTTRVSTEYHLYSKRYYDSRVKSSVDEEIGNEKIDRSKRIAIVNKHLIEKYNNESEEIKQEIRGAIEKERKEKEAEKEAFEAIAACNENLTAEQYMIAQAAAPEMIKDFMELMSQRTGWSFSMLAGGPSPANQGVIRSLAIHSGVNVHGLTFAKFHPNHQKKIVVPFSSFLKTVYPNAPNDKRFQLQKDEKPEEKHGQDNQGAVFHSTIELGTELDNVLKVAQNKNPAEQTSTTPADQTAAASATPKPVQDKDHQPKASKDSNGDTATAGNTELLAGNPISTPAEPKPLETESKTAPEPLKTVPTQPLQEPIDASTLSLVLPQVDTSSQLRTVDPKNGGNAPEPQSSMAAESLHPPSHPPPQPLLQLPPHQPLSQLPHQPPPPNESGPVIFHPNIMTNQPTPVQINNPHVFAQNGGTDPISASQNLTFGPTTSFDVPSAIQPIGDTWNFDNLNDMSISTQYYGSKLGEKPYPYGTDMTDDLGGMSDDIFDPNIIRNMLPEEDWKQFSDFINGRPSFSGNEGTYIQHPPTGPLFVQSTVNSNDGSYIQHPALPAAPSFVHTSLVGNEGLYIQHPAATSFVQTINENESSYIQHPLSGPSFVQSRVNKSIRPPPDVPSVIHSTQGPDQLATNPGPTQRPSDAQPTGSVDTNTAPQAPKPVIPSVSQSGPENLEKNKDSNIEEEVQERSGAKRTRKPSSKEVIPLTSNMSTGHPEWLKAASAYLEEGIDQAEWKKCIDNWIAFEHDIGLTEMSAHRLPAALRPPMLTKHM